MVNADRMHVKCIVSICILRFDFPSYLSWHNVALADKQLKHWKIHWQVILFGIFNIFCHINKHSTPKFEPLYLSYNVIQRSTKMVPFIRSNNSCSDIKMNEQNFKICLIFGRHFSFLWFLPNEMQVSLFPKEIFTWNRQQKHIACCELDGSLIYL